MIFNLPCMSTNKTAKHCIVKTLSKTQLNETSHCIASEEKKEENSHSFLNTKKNKREMNTVKNRRYICEFFLAPDILFN